MSVDGDGRAEALHALLDHPADHRPAPCQKSWRQRGSGGRDGGVNAAPRRVIRPCDTANWADEAGRPGNLRVDYVLPSRTLGSRRRKGFFWPLPCCLTRRRCGAARRAIGWSGWTSTLPKRRCRLRLAGRSRESSAIAGRNRHRSIACGIAPEIAHFKISFRAIGQTEASRHQSGSPRHAFHAQPSARWPYSIKFGQILDD